MLRLKTRAQFQAAMAGGTVSRTTHFALHRLPLGAGMVGDAAASGPGLARAAHEPQALFPMGGAAPTPWLGAMVPKRWARRAVTRNAIRRQIYAVAQESAQQLAPAAHVVRLRAAFDRQHFVSASSDALKQALRAELRALFACAARRKEPAP